MMGTTIAEREADHSRKMWNKWIGNDETFGEIPEYMYASALAEEFNEMGYAFTKTHIEKLRAYADLHSNQWFADKRKYYGAIAGVIMNDSMKTYTLERGFYAKAPADLRSDGETFAITPPTDPYTPKAW
jgi:hypothetical protein